MSKAIYRQIGYAAYVAMQGAMLLSMSERPSMVLDRLCQFPFSIFPCHSVSWFRFPFSGAIPTKKHSFRFVSSESESHSCQYFSILLSILIDAMSERAPGYVNTSVNTYSFPGCAMSIRPTIAPILPYHCVASARPQYRATLQ